MHARVLALRECAKGCGPRRSGLWCASDPRHCASQTTVAGGRSAQGGALCRGASRILQALCTESKLAG